MRRPDEASEKETQCLQTTMLEVSMRSIGTARGLPTLFSAAARSLLPLRVGYTVIRRRLRFSGSAGRGIQAN